MRKFFVKPGCSSYFEVINQFQMIVSHASYRTFVRGAFEGAALDRLGGGRVIECHPGMQAPYVCRLISEELVGLSLIHADDVLDSICAIKMWAKDNQAEIERLSKSNYYEVASFNHALHKAAWVDSFPVTEETQELATLLFAHQIAINKLLAARNVSSFEVA